MSNDCTTHNHDGCNGKSNGYGSRCECLCHQPLTNSERLALREWLASR